MKVSIITVVLNREKVIKDCILSVISQTYKNIEYIIVDGASTDGTIKIINHYKHNIDVLISEKDKGIYDAMNKGVSLASGDLIYFLNSDDKFFDNNVISNIVKAINMNPQFDYYYGGVVTQNTFGSNSKSIFSQEISSQSIRWGENIRHQSIFVRRNLFKKVGDFDTSLKVNADYEWQCRLVNNNFHGYYVNQLVAFYDQSGFSSKGSWQQYLEKYRVIKGQFGSFYAICFYIKSIIRFSLVEIFRKLKILPFISKVLNIIRGTIHKE